jgi:hypothetical protein
MLKKQIWIVTREGSHATYFGIVSICQPKVLRADI